jgi:hypothetical protein
VRKTNRERLFASTLLAGVASLGVPLGIGAAGVMVSATDALAQDYTTGALRGRVLDENGEPVAGAQVTIRSQAQGFVRNTTTNDQGEFTLQVLPTGEYTASITAAGYSPTESRDLRVEAGSANVYAFDLVSGGGDEIVVTAARAQLSFNETTTGIQLNVQELAERVPVGQNVLSLALLAPTAVQGGAGSLNAAFASQPTFGGSSVAENAFFVNGLNITNFDNYFGASLVPFEFYDSVEVKTGGYPAEFGRATGGVVNATTRSGSNDWSVRLSGNYDNPEWSEQAPRTVADANEFDSNERTTYTGELSGPIIRDRLFFYVMAQGRDISNEFATIAGTFNVDETDSPFYAAKVDANITDDHRLEATWFDTTRETIRTTYGFTPALDNGGTIGAFRSNTVFNDGGASYVGRYTGSFTDWFTLSAGYGVNEDSEDTLPGLDEPVISDARQGNAVVSANATGNNDVVARERVFYRVDADFFFDLMGEHHVRVGWDREDLTLGHVTSRAGAGTLGSPLGWSGVYNEGSGTDPYGQADDEMYIAITHFESGGAFEQQNQAYYIQDSWDILDNLTINLGLRMDQFNVETAAGVPFVEFDEEIGPRIGFSWDPANDGANRVYGSYGRYFLPIAANTAYRMGASELFFTEFYEIGNQGTPANPVDDYVAGTGLPVTFGAQITGFASASACPAGGISAAAVNGCEVTGDGTPAVPTALISQTLESTYEDEFLLGWEHRFDNDWTIGLSGMWRTLGRVSEDSALDAAILNYCATTDADAVTAGVQPIANCDDVWTGFHQYVIINPGADATIVLDDSGGLTDGDLVAPGLQSIDGRVIELSAADMGYPSAQRDYYSATLDFERPWDGQWMLQGSYTLSLSEGNFEGQAKSDVGQDDVGITQDFDQPGLVDGSYGLLPNHRAHQFKLFGAYAITENLTIGSNVVVQSGRNFGCLGRHPTDVFAAQYGASSFFCRTDALETAGGGVPAVANGTDVETDRGSQLQADWLTQVDLSLRYALPEAVPGDLTLRLDVFNVFNESTATAFEERGENTNGSRRLLNATAFGANRTAYGYASAFQAPRFVRVGFAWEF